MTIFKKYPRVVLERCDLNKLRAELGIEIGEATSAIVEGKGVSRTNSCSHEEYQSRSDQGQATLQSSDVSCSLMVNERVNNCDSLSVERQDTDDTSQNLNHLFRQQLNHGSNSDRELDENASSSDDEFIAMPIKVELGTDSNNHELTEDLCKDSGLVGVAVSEAVTRSNKLIKVEECYDQVSDVTGQSVGSFDGLLEDQSVSSWCHGSFSMDIKREETDEAGEEDVSKKPENALLKTEHEDVSVSVKKKDSWYRRRKEEDLRVFICKFCGAKFDVRTQLRDHLKVHSGKSHVCPHCPAKFTSMSTLRHHLKVHFRTSAAGNTEKWFPCSQCSAKFTKSYDLESHKMLHSGVKPFSCSMCPAKFRLKCSLTMHSRIHMEDRFSSSVPSPEEDSQERLNEVWKKELSDAFDSSPTSFPEPPSQDPDSFVSGENKPPEDVISKDLFACPHCPAKYKKKCYFQTHLEAHTDAEGTSKNRQFSCQLCSARFSRKFNLTVHMMAHTGDEPFKCPNCSAKFDRKSSLLLHLKSHKLNLKFRTKSRHAASLKSYPRKTKGPGARFLAGKVKRPLQKERVIRQDDFTCSHCPAKFMDNRNLKAHLKVHSNKTIQNRPFSCPFCSAKFGHIRTLKDHMAVHTGKYPYKCGECPAKFCIEKSLRKHMRSHQYWQSLSTEPIKSMKSDLCSQSGSAETSMADATVTYHPSQASFDVSSFSCTHCPAIFKSKVFLVKHMMKHEDKSCVACPHCPAKFTKRQSLLRHLKAHSIGGNRPFSCQMCSARFTLNYHLENHLVVHTGKYPFSCSLCASKFACERVLNAHMKCHANKQSETNKSELNSESNNTEILTTDHPLEQTSHKLPSFSCTMCPANYKRKVYLLNHMKKHEDKSRFVCSHCPAKFLKHQCFVRHLKAHSKESVNRPFACQMCSAKFILNFHLEEHMVVHTGKYPFKCAQCPSKFGSRRILKLHMVYHANKQKEVNESEQRSESSNAEMFATEHPSQETSHKLPSFSCAVCPANYKSQVYLAKHMRKHDRFVCTHCPAKFTEKKGLKSHLKVHSKREKKNRPYSCQMCSASFLVQFHLDEHIKVHSGNEPFRCTQCPAKFFSERYLNLHMRCHANMQSEVNESEQRSESSNAEISVTYHPSRQVSLEMPSFSCTICPAIYNSEVYFVKHMKKHEDKYSFTCPHCPAKYITKRNLNYHLEAHSKEGLNRPFSCKMCSAKFMTNYHLKAHLLVHTGKYPFRCTQCSAKFGIKAFLRSHMKSHLKAESLSIEQSESNESDQCTQSGVAEIFVAGTPSTDHSPEQTSHKLPSFSCTQCTAVYKKRIYFMKHLKKHEDKSRYACIHCPAKFNEHRHLRQHLKAHVGGGRERPYSCNSCSAKFIFKTHLKEHLPVHTGKFPFRCPHCPAKFGSNRCFQSHMRRHLNPESLLNKEQENNGSERCRLSDKSETVVTDSIMTDHLSVQSPHKMSSFSCTQCPAIYKSKIYFDNHMKTHKEKSYYYCAHCPSRCETKHTLKKHLKCHSSKHPDDRIFACPHCSAKFNRLSALKAHNYVHTGKSPFSCHLCSNSFIMKCHLVSHMAIKHSNTDSLFESSPVSQNFASSECSKASARPLFSCKHCTAKFLEKTSLENHEMLKHADTNVFRCPLCPAEFHKNVLLNRHLKVHDKLNKCKQCSAKFWKKANLLIHVNKYHANEKLGSNLKMSHLKVHGNKTVDKVFACKHCGKKCCDKYSLIRHMKMKHANKSVSLQPKQDGPKTRHDVCPFCPAKFLCKSSLRKHLLVHQDRGLKPYTCNHCSASYSQERFLTEHLLVHSTDESMFSCSYCQAEFSSFLNLSAHLRRHQSDPLPVEC